MYEGERFNSITHLVGAVAGLVGMVTLIVLASLQGDPWKIVSFSIYGTTLLLLYLASTLYHSLRGRAKEVFQKLDRIAIYLFIAGTYTPFTLVTLRGPWGWSLLVAIWGLALTGIASEFLPGPRKPVLSLIVYLLMGWLCLVAAGPFIRALPWQGLAWLVSGGVFYTVGVVFYIFSNRVKHFHGIWHLFVIAGSLGHYGTILLFMV